MPAYYNEIDPGAAAWLQELIRAGHIAAGDVDTRSIEDVTPNDLRPYTQCHFFAGIGVWSYALRCAGWPDDRPVWTGSCPCQPFSSAGKGAGFTDERHLWPAFHWLIQKCRPGVVFGEQVASKDGLAWLDLVQADLEGSGYASGAVDTCAAGFGAPHLRQRLYWVAESHRERHDGIDALLRQWSGHLPEAAGGGEACGMADADREQRLWRSGGKGCEPNGTAPGWVKGDRESFADCETGGVADDQVIGRREERPNSGRGDGGNRAEGLAAGPLHGGDALRLADGGQPGLEERQEQSARDQFASAERGGDADRPGPTNGFWRAADWLGCRDGKWRPVEPGTFPLADGAPARVGRLRGFGNAIVAPQAQAFVEAYLSLDSQ